ncbi:RES family NAD+ phosphorylase [Rhizobium hidalgonense]|uniref:RES family NAD+ phosphorylase n=1 Tax=Rhizobium hidalgonense TaxID=1538159 RepID=UPI001105EB04|nr:RES family NAD+ phosphorylase [Rhizobium hidalgonense]QKK26836.1 RES family NAD+ phosphorylase [Rhizobium hidalgonense]
MGTKVPPPPSTFASINVKTVAAGDTLHRTHATAFRAGEFNPCRGQPTRFAPFDDAAGLCVPSLYAATTREAAAFESIFHDIAPSARFKTVRLATVLARSTSRIRPKRDLRVVSLYAPDLKAWRISRVNLIETPKSTYRKTVLWASAIHNAYPDVDGLVWTSRQCDPNSCVIFFGDRVHEADFDVVDCIDVSSDPNLLLEIRGYGRRAGITII